MSGRRYLAARTALATLLLCAWGCSPANNTPPASPANDPDPSFTDAERQALASLSPSMSPPAPAADVSNSYADNPAAAAFGQKLFFFKGFAGALLDADNTGETGTLGTQGATGKVACADCHVPASGFTDTRSPSEQISLASGWGKRRAPSLLDVGQTRLIMWDGRRDALYNQVFGPIESPVEMNSSRLYAAEQVFASYRSDYEAVFGPMPALGDATQFPLVSAGKTGCHPPSGAGPTPICNGTWDGSPGDKAEFDSMSATNQSAVTRVVVNVGKAIAAYERLLACGPSRFDQWMHGNATALTRAEQRGAEVFVGPGRCVTCHSGPFLSDQKFHDVGLAPLVVASAFIDAQDPGASTGVAQALADPLNTMGSFSDGYDGRLPASVPPSWLGAFRTPALRCVSRRPSFFHTGQTRSLADVVAFFNRGGDTMDFQGASEIQALNLNALQQSDLTAFLSALDGPGPAAALLAAP